MSQMSESAAAAAAAEGHMFKLSLQSSAHTQIYMLIVIHTQHLSGSIVNMQVCMV